MNSSKHRAAAIDRGIKVTVHKRVFRLALLAALSALPGYETVAQAPSPASPQAASTFHGYDVITIKPNKSGSGSSHWSSDATTVTATNMSLRLLLASASGIRESLITGLPAWAERDRWDIQAKIVDPDPALKTRTMTREASQAEYHAQVLSILTERFQVKTHTETSEQPVYDLVVARGGSKLQPHSKANGSEDSLHRHNDLLEATGVHLPEFAKSIERDAGRSVVDKTGLTGSYDFTLKWSRSAQDLSTVDNGSEERLPSLFQALEEQLGLKLVPARGLVATLVVDSIVPPILD